MAKRKRKKKKPVQKKENRKEEIILEACTRLIVGIILRIIDKFLE